MAFSTMYDGKINSPVTSVNETLSDSDTTITVTDASVLPAAPNLAVIGTGEDAETILYTGKSTNDLTGVTRGFEGAAKAWSSGTQIARLFTHYDYDALKTNVEKLQENNPLNLVIDGNFDYWLSAVTATDPATLAYIHTLSQVKHTKSSGTRPTITISRQALTAGDLSKSFYCNRCAAGDADSSLDNASYYIWIRHYIYQGVRKYGNGGKITVSCQAKSSVAGQKIGICMRQNYGSGGSPSSEENIVGGIKTLTTSFAEYNQTFTTNTNSGKTFGTDNNDCLIIDIFVQAGSTVASALFGGTAFGFTEAVNIDLCQLAAYRGEEAQEFIPQDDFDKIEEFYQKTYNKSVLPGTASDYNGIFSALTLFQATHITNLTIPLKKRMRKTPVITFYAFDGTKNYATAASRGTYAIDAIYSTSETTVTRAINISELTSEWVDIYCHWVADARYADSPS